MLASPVNQHLSHASPGTFLSASTLNSESMLSSPSRSTPGSSDGESSPSRSPSPDSDMISEPASPRTPTTPTSTSHSLEPALVVIDPVSTGACLVAQATARGIPVIRLFSDVIDAKLKKFIPLGMSLEFVGDVEHLVGASIESTCDKIKALGRPIMGVLAGCETGVEITDAIAAGLNVPHNDPALTLCRRNKYMMGERVRSCGVRAVKQFLATEWKPIQTFLTQEFTPEPFKCIIKPVQSAGSDGVYFCTTVAEVQMRFESLMGTTNVLGASNASVLIQEYLEGPEYVIDTVSHHGEHKVCAMWTYDKRSTNGMKFVYHGKRFVSADEDGCAEMIAYTKQVLDALAIRHGVGHAEVIMTPTGPCLVEIGARPHGGEGSWLPITEACLGYDVLSVSLDCVMDPSGALFSQIPEVPILKKCFGNEAYMVSRVTGTLVGYQHMDMIQALPSFRKLNMYIPMGHAMVPSVDFLTCPGSILMMNESKEQLDRDMEIFQSINTSVEGFWVIKNE